MFERFTEDARRVVNGARTLAIARGDDRIGALHMLSALTTGDGVAARVLASNGVDAEAVRRLLGPGVGQVASAEDDAEALASLGIDLDEIRRRVEQTFGEGALDRLPAGGTGSGSRRGHSALTDDAKSALALSLREAQALHHNYIGTEHLLLGLLRTADRRKNSGLQQALAALGLRYAGVRDQVIALLATA
jgi:ATP-dependent Clp protease ATP-binding subunit ClpA